MSAEALVLVDELFRRLTLRYGHKFPAQWPGLEIADVKADWARELAAYADKPWAVEHALALLDLVVPPTAAQFRALCCSAPAPAQPAQPLIKLANRAAEVRRRVLRPVLPHTGRDLRWAMEMVRRADAGEHVRSYNLSLARAALAQPRSD